MRVIISIEGTRNLWLGHVMGSEDIMTFFFTLMKLLYFSLPVLSVISNAI